MLLHEYSHIKLHLLSDCDPLLDPEHHGDGWTKTYYYSPWREDPRPIKGILHGFFVFVEVAAFWASRIESKHYHGSDPIAQQRFKTVFSQLLIACDVLRDHGHFTATGHDLMNELEQRLSAMKPIAASIDGDRIAPIYAEMRGGDPATATSINEAIRRHREQFAREHEV
jgi:hypothetical protein